MPMYESPIPIGGSALVAEDDDGVTYTLTVGTATFTRTGEDGAQIILPLFGGDEFYGEALEGFWKKGWDAGMDTARPLTAIIDGSGTLDFTGEADAAGVAGNGWINGHLPLPLLDELEVIVTMKVPVDDTGGVADRDIFYDFYLRRDEKAVDIPSGDADFIRVRFDVDETGLILIVSKEVATVNTVLDSGDDYTMDGGRGTGDLEAVVWRFVFHNGVAGVAAPSNGRHMHVYMRQSDTIANAELATENQLDDSPYDISDLLFNVAWPAFMIYSQNTTYYDTGNEAQSTRITVDYPEFNLRYDVADADRNKGEVELWDGDPSVATSQRVFDEDHEFASDPYLQNGLIRLHSDEGVNYGLDIQYYDGAAWTRLYDRFYFFTVSASLNIISPRIKSIVKVSPTQTIIDIRVHNSSLEDDDFFVDVRVTLNQGSPIIKFSLIEVSPSQNTRVVYLNNAGAFRFGYCGDDVVGDDDLNITGNNTTLTDNFLLGFDNAGVAALIFLFTNKKPDGGNDRFEVLDGGDLIIEDVAAADVSDTIIWAGMFPFSLIANLFEEAEDTTLDGGADTANPAVGESGTVARLDAQNEGNHGIREAGTHLPEGRYLAFWRDYCVGATQAYDIRVYNNTDSEHRNEENEYVTVISQNNTWTYRSLVFDITGADVTGTDAIWLQALQPNAGPNTVYLDYLLIVPIGDGESLPQDLAHAVMREKSQPRRVFAR